LSKMKYTIVLILTLSLTCPNYAQKMPSDNGDTTKYLTKGLKALKASYGTEPYAGLKFQTSETGAVMPKVSIDYSRTDWHEDFNIYFGLIFFAYFKTNHEFKPFIGFGPQLGIIGMRDHGINYFDFSIFPGIEWFLIPKLSLVTEYQIRYWRSWDNYDRYRLNTGINAEILRLGMSLYLN